MKNNRQYNQDDINKIVSIKEEEDVIKDTENMQVPQIEIIEKEDFTEEQLMAALLFAQDMLERSSIPFVLLHQTAEDVHQSLFPVLTGNIVNLGVMKRHMTVSGTSMLKSLLNQNAKNVYMDDSIVTFEYKNVPVQIDIVHNDYPFFKNPDVRFFRLTEFRIANPFDDYLLWKDEIK